MRARLTCLFLCASTVGIAISANFFCTGTVWVAPQYCFGTNTDLTNTYGVIGEDTLQLINHRSSSPQSEAIVFACDGDKVYSKANNGDFLLMYDFNVAVGDTIRVYPPAATDFEFHNIYADLVCTSKAYPKELGGLAAFTFKSSGPELYGWSHQEIWIEGVGSIRGPNENAYFGALGGCGQFLKMAISHTLNLDLTDYLQSIGIDSVGEP